MKIDSCEKNYIPIISQECLESFWYNIDNLHDAIIKEVSIISREGYVKENGWMHGDVSPFDSRIVFHSQFEESPCIEIIFETILKFKFESGFDFSPKGIFEKDKVTIYFQQDSFMVIAKNMKYRILDRSFVGPGSFCTAPIPQEGQNIENEENY